MTYEEFTTELARLGLSKQVFAEDIGYSYKSVLNFKQYGVPSFTASWLKYYEGNKNYKEIIEKIKNT
jgi:hypothetical protein